MHIFGGLHSWKMMIAIFLKENMAYLHKYSNHRFAAHYLKSYALNFQVSPPPYQDDGGLGGHFVGNAALGRSSF